MDDYIQENGQKAVPWTNEESQSADHTLFPLNTEARGLSGQLQNISFLLELRDLCVLCLNKNGSETIHSETA